MKLFIASLLLAACTEDTVIVPPPEFPASWTIVVSPDAPEGVQIAASDVERYLGEMQLGVTRDTSVALECTPGQGVVAFLGDGVGEPAFTLRDLNDQTFAIAETRCEGGRFVALSGNGLLGRQYAAYEWLHVLGVRFFHPEQTFVPERATDPAEAIAIERTPPFRWRSVGLHLTHPIELGDPMRQGDETLFPEVQRFIDWQIRNFASLGTGGVGTAELADYGWRRGFPRESGMSLHGTQQGARSVIDPDSPLTEEQQMAAAIDMRMMVDPQPRFFTFTFNPSEFTEMPDTDVVRQMEFIGTYFAEHYPETQVMTINHGTAQEPTANYGVRYFDLSRFAPPNIGVKVHTLMFYDLFRPAPVYGNTDFNFLYDFMVDEYQTRKIWHFPEAAWWLTFDIAVPLYLPITIEARDRDIQGISFMLDGGLEGHNVFATGHEWGYWQNEYCSYRMAANLEYRWQDCVRDIASSTGEAAPEVAAVLEELVATQERDIVYGDLIAYLVGSDSETEIAQSVGIEFHPLPPAPGAIMRWDLDQVGDFQRRIRPGLERMDADMTRLADRMRAVEAIVPENGRPFFAEILDGIEANGLRARHAAQLYGALVTRREADLRFDAMLRAASERLLGEALATTELARAVIARRETGYRYLPIERSIAGGEAGTEDMNWTVYGYRYLNRTHHAFYYTRPDALARQALAGGTEPFVLEDAMIGPEERAKITAVGELTSVSIDWGDGMTSSGGPVIEHTYAMPGFYTIAATGMRGAERVELTAEIAVLSEEWTTGFSARVVEPADADIIEPVLPALVLGPAGEGQLAVGFSSDEATHFVDARLWQRLTPSAASTAVFESQPARFVVPIINRMTGEVRTSVIVDEGVAHGMTAAGPFQLTGNLSTEAVVHAIVAIGGFDERGARNVVAATLGYTAETLPSAVPFEVEFTRGPPSK